MSSLKLLAFPIISSALMLYLWLSNRLGVGKAVMIEVTLNLVYVFLQVYRYGLLQLTVGFGEEQWPAFTYYFKEYDCKYSDAREKVFKELSEADRNMLKTQPQVNYMEVYLDKSKKSYKESAGRVTVGFALQGDAEKDIGIAKVLECLNYDKRELKPCKAVHGRMKMVDEYSGRLALRMWAGPAWDTVEKHHGGQGTMFIWEGKKSLACGVFVGPESKQFLVKVIPSEPNAQSFLVNDPKKFK